MKLKRIKYLIFELTLFPLGSRARVKLITIYNKIKLKFDCICCCSICSLFIGYTQKNCNGDMNKCRKNNLDDTHSIFYFSNNITFIVNNIF